MRVGIIGTAGRGRDGERLDWPTYLKMYAAAAAHVGPDDDLVSGGAPGADLLAVILFLKGVGRSLTLYLPADFNHHSGLFFPDLAGSDARIINHYYDLFSRRLGAFRLSSLLTAALYRGADLVICDGFKNRNILVGNSMKLIALTFGTGCVPKDGGTKHCWDNSTAQERIHIPIGSL